MVVALLVDLVLMRHGGVLHRRAWRDLPASLPPYSQSVFTM